MFFRQALRALGREGSKSEVLPGTNPILVPGLPSPCLPYFSKTNPFRLVRCRFAQDLFDFNTGTPYDCGRLETNGITRYIA